MNWATLSTSKLRTRPLLCHHSEMEVLIFKKIHRWSCGHVNTCISPCETHTVCSRWPCCPRTVQTPRPPVQPVSYPARGHMRTDPPREGQLPWMAFLCMKNLLPEKCRLQSKHSFCLSSFLPTRKISAFNKVLKREREKDWTCQRLLLLPPLCDRYRGRWLFKFPRQTDNDR